MNKKKSLNQGFKKEEMAQPFRIHGIDIDFYTKLIFVEDLLFKNSGQQKMKKKRKTGENCRVLYADGSL